MRIRVSDLPRSVRQSLATLQRSPLSILLLILCILPGCVVGDFMGVYFNTLYNARHQFNEAEDEVWNLPEAKVSGRNYLIQFGIQSSTRTKFTAVIEKCSKLLQYHPDSRYVDDALMMIGKSYYYEADYAKAERKFKELINGYPESAFIPEAKYLLAYSYYREDSKPEAIALAKDVMQNATERGDDGIVARAALVLGEIELDGKNYETARDQFLTAATKADNAELRATTYLRVGGIDSLVGDYVGARTAYARAVDESGNYVVQYRGRIGMARMTVLQGQYDDGLSQLADLRANLNYREFFGEIELETANTYNRRGDIRGAIERYRRIDTVFARSESAARSLYQLGMLYETKLSRYDSARIAFDHGRTEFPQSPVTALIVHHADYLGSYFRFRSEIAKNDSIRVAMLAPRDTTQAPAAQGTDSLDAAKRIRSDSLKISASRVPPVPLDTIKFRIADNEAELAGLFATTIGKTDSAEYWYRRLLGEYGDSPFIPRALYSLAQMYSLDSTVARTVVDSLYRELVRRYPDSEFADEARRNLGLPPLEKRTDLAALMYAHGQQFILDGNGPAAIDTMKELIRLHPSSSYAAKAQYAVGWVYEHVTQQNDSALANYRLLVQRYPGTPYAIRVQPLIVASNIQAATGAAPARKDSTIAPAPPVVRQTEQKPPGEQQQQPQDARTNRERRRGRGAEDSMPHPPGPPGGGEEQRQ